MASKTKSIVFNIFLFIIASIISFFLCLYVLDVFFIPVYIMDFGRITFRLLVSFSIYILIRWVFNKKITINNQKILFLLYILFIVGLLLSREPFRNDIELVNFQIGFIKDSSKFIFIANLFMYIPVGFYAPKLFNINTKVLILVTCLFIFGIEILQLLSRVGYIDINDIILNIFSFSVGVFIRLIIKKKKLVERPSSIYNNRE